MYNLISFLMFTYDTNKADTDSRLFVIINNLNFILIFYLYSPFIIYNLSSITNNP